MKFITPFIYLNGELKVLSDYIPVDGLSVVFLKHFSV